MAERASVTQHIQIGVETTPGTSVAATKQLRSLGFAPTPKMTIQQFRPPGQKFISLAVEGEEWIEAAMTGSAVYDELIYPLSSCLGAATVMTLGTSPNFYYQWIFGPSATNPENFKSFTVQHGDPIVRADQFSFGLVTDVQFSMDRTKFDVTGTMLGQSLTDNIAFTSNPTLLPLVPIVPATVSIFADTTASGIGVTQLSRVLTFDWHITNKYGPIWTLDATKSSFAGTVDLVPTLTATILMEADANGMQFLNTVRAGSTMYVRIKSAGPTIGLSSGSYAFQMDLPVKVINTQGFSDSNGVYAIQWEFACVFDNTFGIPPALGAGGITLSTAGTAGSASYFYKLVGHTPSGFSAPSTEYSISTGNATLNATNYNILTLATPQLGVGGYDIYRGTTTNGENTLVASNVSTFPYQDQGGGSAATPPTAGASTGGAMQVTLQNSLSAL